MLVDFTSIKLYTDISKQSFINVNVKDEVANMIYNNLAGLTAHAFAMRIHNSDGKVDVSPQEFEILEAAINEFAKPGFIDGFKEMMEGVKNNIN